MEPMRFALEDIAKGRVTLLLSAINYAEVLNNTRDSKAGTDFRQFVNRSNVIRASADFRVAELSSAISERTMGDPAAKGVKPADALIAATTIIYHASELLTFDDALLKAGGTPHLDHSVTSKPRGPSRPVPPVPVESGDGRRTALPARHRPRRRAPPRPRHPAPRRREAGRTGRGGGAGRSGRRSAEELTGGPHRQRAVTRCFAKCILPSVISCFRGLERTAVRCSVSSRSGGGGSGTVRAGSGRAVRRCGATVPRRSVPRLVGSNVRARRNTFRSGSGRGCTAAGNAPSPRRLGSPPPRRPPRALIGRP